MLPPVDAESREGFETNREIASIYGTRAMSR
jgi:hypothetical protein